MFIKNASICKLLVDIGYLIIIFLFTYMVDYLWFNFALF